MTNENQGPSRGGRPLTGTVVKLKTGPHAGQLQGIVTLADGSRQRLPPFPRGTSLAMAKDKTLAKQEAARAAGITKPVLRPPSDVPAEGTVSAWFERFAAFRETRGLTSVKDDRSRFANHVKGTLGALAMATVTREDLEGLVRSLDAKIQGQELSWKSAQNVWMLVTKMFSEAVRSKLPELRVRTDNPCKEVAAPDRGVSKAKVYLYPSELATFLECEKVPVRWRRMVAVAVYLGVRAGELDALEWGDVDLEHGVVHVHRALDRSRPGKAKSTKTGSARRFRIEPELLPLLTAMRHESGGVGTVFPALKLTGRSEKLRMFLLRAGVRRAELHASDATRKPLGWHDLRATSATWLAVKGEEPLKIMQRLGHRNFATTMLYVREAEQLREGFGVPFAALPEALLRGVSITGFDHEELSVRNYGAGHGARTRDPELGKRSSRTKRAQNKPNRESASRGGSHIFRGFARAMQKLHAETPAA